MSEYCRRHRQWSAWGCRECLHEELRRAVAEGIERLRAKLRALPLPGEEKP